MNDRLTKKIKGVFKYDLKDYKHKSSEFNDYDAFFAYNMAIKKLGELEDKHESFVVEIEQLTQENEQLRQALRKCDPFGYQIDWSSGTCIFCEADYETKFEHNDNCEYKRLIGGDGE